MIKFGRAAKVIGVVGATVLTLLVGALFLVDWYLGSDAFKERFTESMSRLLNREVVIESELGVSVFPWLGVETGDVWVANDPGFGPDPLLLASEVTAKIRLIPLLSRELVLDTVVLKDIGINLARKQDGTSNWNSLLDVLMPEGAVELPESDFDLKSLSVRGIQISNATMHVYDELEGREMYVRDVFFRTGMVEPEKPLDFSLEGGFSHVEWGMDARVSLSGGLDYSVEDRSARISNAMLEVVLTGEFLPEDGDSIMLTAKASVDTNEDRAELTGVWLQFPKLFTSGHLEITSLFTNPHLAGRMSCDGFAPRETVNHYIPGRIPDKDLEIFTNASFTTRVEADADHFTLEDLILVADESEATGNATIQAMDGNSSLAMYSFNLELDQLDFDRYYDLWVTPEPYYFSDLYPGFIHGWNAEGDIHVGKMHFSGAHSKSNDIYFKSGNGTFSVDVETLGVNGGTFVGSYFGTVDEMRGGKYPISMKLSLAMSGVDAGALPLLSGESYKLVGRTDVQFEASTPTEYYAPDEILADVMRDMTGVVTYNIGSGSLDILDPDGGGKPELDSRIGFSSAGLKTRFTAQPKRGKAGWYTYDASTVARAFSTTEPYSFEADIKGPLRLSTDLENVRLSNVAIALSLQDGFLPADERVAKLESKASLDTQKQSLTISAMVFNGLGMRAAGGFTGENVLSDNYVLSGTLNLRECNPRKLIGLFGKEPDTRRDSEALKSLTGSAVATINDKGVVLTGVDFMLDDTRLTGVVKAPDFGDQTVTFNLHGDDIDLDRYREPKKEGDPCELRKGRKPKRFPLLTLREMNLEGLVEFDRIKIYNLQFTDLSAQLSAHGGRLAAEDVNANMYGGLVSGDVIAVAGKDTMDLELIIGTDKFDCGPFMVDQAGQAYVDGTSDIYMSLKGSGANDQQIYASLNGNVGVKIWDGSYDFSDEEDVEKREKKRKSTKKRDKNRLGMSQDSLEKRAKDPRTNFSFGEAHFRVDGGQFDLERFMLDTSLMTTTGRGGFNLAKDDIDITLTADFIAAPDVPIRIYGCLYNPGVEVPGDELLGNTLKDIIGIPLKPFQYLGDIFF